MIKNYIKNYSLAISIVFSAVILSASILFYAFSNRYSYYNVQGKNVLIDKLTGTIYMFNGEYVDKIPKERLDNLFLERLKNEFNQSMEEYLNSDEYKQTMEEIQWVIEEANK